MFANLSPRERWVLALGGGFALLVAVYFGGLVPYWEAVDAMEARIASRQRQMLEVHGLQREYRDLQRQLDEAELRLVKARNFSLFSFVEGVTSQVAGKENLVYMRPQAPAEQDGFREESVEVKLERIPLNQLVRLLYAVDSSDVHLQVKNLRLKTRFDDRSLLDAVMTIAHYRRS